jgi:hypothetical protein
MFVRAPQRREEARVSWRGRIPDGFAARIHLASRIRRDNFATLSPPAEMSLPLAMGAGLSFPTNLLLTGRAGART